MTTASTIKPGRILGDFRKLIERTTPLNGDAFTIDELFVVAGKFKVGSLEGQDFNTVYDFINVYRDGKLDIYS